MAVAVWLFVGAWLLLTVCNQFEALARRVVSKVDHFNLVPRWTFFAPQPGRTDLHLVYRECLAHGPAGPWTEVYPVTVRSPLTLIWNPRKRHRKAITDLVNGLMRGAAEGRGHSATVSIPYLAFLNVVSHRAAANPRAALRQFAVVATNGPLSEEPPRMLMHSKLHPVDRHDC